MKIKIYDNYMCTVKIRYCKIYKIKHLLISENRLCISAIDCGSLVSPMNGSMTGSITVYPNKIQFNCNEGFDLLGSATRTCLPSGMWSGNQTTCEGI